MRNAITLLLSFLKINSARQGFITNVLHIHCLGGLGNHVFIIHHLNGNVILMIHTYDYIMYTFCGILMMLVTFY